MKHVLKAVEDDDERMAAFVRMIAATGMRRGEACGLRWSCIDWDSGTVKIQDAIVTADGGAVVKPPNPIRSVSRWAGGGSRLNEGFGRQ
jgi:integrase